MDLFAVFRVSASALEAQRTRMNTIASNLANIHTTRSEAGGPYRKKDVVFSSAPVDPGASSGLEGVKVAEILESPEPFKKIYDPAHPDADPDGFVVLPNINVMEEMVNMMMALRAYEANVTTFNMSKTLFLKALEIGR